MKNQNFIKTAVLLIAVTISLKVSAQTIDAAKDPRIAPQVREFLKKLNDAGKGQTPIYKLPGTGPADALTALQNQTQVDMSGIEVTERDITQGGVAVHIHIMKPEGATDKLPVVVFYHGGVWLVGNYDNHKRLVRDIVVGTGFAAVFVDYSLLPGSKYPTQINQAYAALTWVADHGEEIGVDPNRMAIAGNSVGGNMAAAIALMAKDKNGPALRMEVLLYPAVGADFNTNSYKTYADGRFLTKDFMEFGYNLYTPSLQTRKEIYAVPMAATIDQVKGLPRTLIQTDDNDPLRDEGEAYGRKLLEAGVDCSVIRYMSLTHDFQVLNAINDVPGVKESIRQVCVELKDALK